MEWQLITALLGAATIVGGFIGWLLPSPRDREREASQADRDARAEQTRRLRQVELDHRSLENRYIESNAKLGAKVDNLAGVVSTLSVDVRELTAKMARHDNHANGH